MAVTVPLEQALGQTDLALVTRLGASAARMGVSLWFVGGPVRDALLGLPVADLDVTSERPADEVAALLAQEPGGRILARSQFGTVKLRLGEQTVDLATVRSERYERPGALPTVGPGGLADDLARRDFSINAMAASLSPERFGELLDLTGGLEDLRTGVVRALHAGSFQNDATRILRAVRYAARLRFRIHRTTRRWLQRDLAYLDTISPPRVRRELERTLAEADAPRALLLAHRLGVLEAVHPALGTGGVRDALRRARHGALSREAMLGVLLYAVPADAVESLVKRLGLTRRQRELVRHLQALHANEAAIGVPGTPASAIAKLAGAAPKAAPEGAMEAAAAAAPPASVRRALRAYLRRSRRSAPALRGGDLTSMGVPQGPTVGRLLAELRAGVLDGRLRTRAQEEDYVRVAMKREGVR